MNPEKVIEAASAELKQKLQESLDNLQTERLTPELAAEFTRGLQEAITSAAQSGYRVFLESYDLQEDQVIANGQRHRYKQESKKKF
jgi:tRNA A37 N6-isopentenylltransferase MiaA